jgi:hypothetical protein
MGPLTATDRIEGRKAMEASLSPATRARRRFMAGPRRKKGVLLKPLEALSFAVSKYERLQALMLAESGGAADFTDTRAALVYTTPDKQHTAWLPVTREETLTFAQSIMTLDPETTFFPGMIFYQLDREAKPGVEQRRFWGIPLMAGPLAEKVLRDAEAGARAGDLPWLKRKAKPRLSLNSDIT